VLWIQPDARFVLSVDRSPQDTGISLGVCRFDLLGKPVLRLPEPYRIGQRPIGESLLDELMSGSDADDTIAPLMQRAVLARILARCFIAERSSATASVLNAAVRARIVAFMHSNLHRRFGIHELAHDVDMNPAYLSQRFRMAFGAAPRSYIMRLRIQRAANLLLASDDRIEAIAQRFGYDSVFLFSRQFRQVMGQSPTTWRRHGVR
jgi:AraC-like DNA-binding protein